MKNKKLKIVFMGTPEFSVPVLEALIENYQVVGVVTQPDKEVGRHHEIKPTPVKEVALKNNIVVFQPQRIKKEYQEILDLKADLIVTCAYGQMIPKEILEAPQYGCINVHASLLPKLRGGAPIHRAIINNETRTGVTIMYMVEKMDAGDILAQIDTPIYKEDNVGILHDRLSKMGAKLLIETIPDLIAGKIKPIPQNEEEVTYAWNIKREEEKIDFNKRTIDIYNQIRGLNPWPGGYALLEGKVVKIYEARISDSFFTTKKNGEIGKIYEDGIGVSTKDGEIIITKLQPSGKRKMLAKEYLNGVHEEDLLGKVFNEE
ncbi:MAG TPA: methionyl-tRNA formyltransferase [Candidatus Scybalousia intestinigallinarum]|nr:methionyl-tRNA formyltransferase [Candidatus Scybalousia intestinigallinarum]